MGGALISYQISQGSTFRYSTILCALRPIWSRFILKIFLRIILGSWSTPRFTKRPLTSTSGRATLTLTSTCLTLLSSFQSGRYLGHCIICQVSWTLCAPCKDYMTDTLKLWSGAEPECWGNLFTWENWGVRKNCFQAADDPVLLPYTNTNINTNTITNGFTPRYLNSLLGPRRRGRGQRGLILLDHHW